MEMVAEKVVGNDGEMRQRVVRGWKTLRKGCGEGCVEGGGNILENGPDFGLSTCVLKQ